MRRYVLLFLLAVCWIGPARGQGLLMPTDKSVSSLSLVDHKVNVTIEDQVAVTKVEQTFRNHTDRALEATYLFPVPAGANVKKFTMWVDGKEVNGELVEATKAAQIYTEIVRKMQDPGLLEYVGNNLLRVRVFPVPARGDQKISVCFTSIADNENGVVEYCYPLKHSDKVGNRLEHVSIDVEIKSQKPVHNIYSPSHQVKIQQKGDCGAKIHFEENQTLVRSTGGAFGHPPAPEIGFVTLEFQGQNRDFQLYYTTDAKDVGLTALFHRPERSSDGHFLLLLSPRAELAKTQVVPRDVVLVLDTSGSMQGKRIIQAKKALLHCLRGLQPQDRFAMIHFASDVHKYKEKMLPANAGNLEQAERWVTALEVTGGTAINDALAAALAMRPGAAGRNFTVVFFTDGQPTVGETSPDAILKNVEGRNTANTRIFTFGVGDDVNTVLLDRLAERTRSVSTYVRETEDIEDKVSKLYQKISKPVLTDLKLHVEGQDPKAKYIIHMLGSQLLQHNNSTVTVSEIYPQQLPDLFHGNQLVILGKYSGKGETTIRLTGMVGTEERVFEYKVRFPSKAKDGKDFVEELWARRKVGYLLTQIRQNGDNKELVDEVVLLAKKYGITTPYTSYLVAPDGAPTPVAGNNAFRNLGANGNRGVQPAWQFGDSISPSQQWSLPNGAMPPGASASPKGIKHARASVMTPAPVSPALPAVAPAYDSFGPLAVIRRAEPDSSASGLTRSYASAVPCTSSGTVAVPHSGSQAVDYAVCAQDLQRQDQVTATAVKRVAGHTFRQVGGFWVDESLKNDMQIVAIKPQSNAYFDILSKHPEVRDVFLLGNQIKWVTPSGRVLVIDASAGRDDLSAAEIDALFSKN